MIFFRIRLMSVRIRSGASMQADLFYLPVKVSFSSPVDPFSGMTVNLKDVDHELAQASRTMPLSFLGLEDFLECLFKILKLQTSTLESVEVRKGSSVCRYDGAVFQWRYRLSTLICEGDDRVHRKVELKSLRRLSVGWRRKFSMHIWSDSENLAKTLEEKIPSLQEIKIEKPELQSFEKFIFSNKED